MVLGVDQSKYDICDCEGLREFAMAQPNFGQHRQNITKMTITSVVNDTSMHSLALR